MNQENIEIFVTELSEDRERRKELTSNNTIQKALEVESEVFCNLECCFPLFTFLI